MLPDAMPRYANIIGIQDLQWINERDAPVCKSLKCATCRFNTGVAQHYFCSRCGIYTHHRRRSNPNQYGVNTACLKGVSPFDFADVPVIDGVNHPADQGRGYEIVGHLRFIRV
jgi:hypothetical protein